MDVREERLKILEMVAQGTISPEEGARLLEAVEGASGSDEGVSTSAKWTPRWLRIRVMDEREGNVQANIRLPWKLVQAVLKLGGRFNILDLNDHEAERVLQALQEAVKMGQWGKIVEIEAPEKGQRVEILFE